MNTPGYAELHCLSNFSFQRGASSADELFRRAREQGYQAWRSPTNARWPVSCAPGRPPRRISCG
jgi:hypothetical protein